MVDCKLKRRRVELAGRAKFRLKSLSPQAILWLDCMKRHLKFQAFFLLCTCVARVNTWVIGWTLPVWFGLYLQSHYVHNHIFLAVPSWRMTYYAALFIYGAHTLWDKPWLWDTNECWRNWPEHHTPDDVYWYYAVQAGFYLALSVTLFFDHKRKDFTEMIVHHFATLLLMFLSWTINFVRVGTLVLLVHDCVDPLLEGAKMAKYAKKDGLCTLLFVLFFLTWIVTRMMLYPFRIIHSTLFEAVPYVGMSDIYYAFNFLLITLQILHIIWFYFILLIAKEALFQGEFKKDSRSSDESVSDDNTPKESLSDIAADKNGLKGLEQNGLSGHKTSRK